MSAIKYEKITQEDREIFAQEYYNTVVDKYRGEKLEGDLYQYNVQIQDINFVTSMTDEEVKQSANYAIDILEELKAMNNDGIDTATFDEMYLKVGDNSSRVIEMMKVWNIFKNDRLDQLIGEIDQVMRVGGAYASIISNPCLIDAILVVYEKLVDNFDDEDLYIFAGYFMMRAIMRMRSEEIDDEEDEEE